MKLYLMTEIANQKNISVFSVYRIIKKFYQPTNPFRKQLPKALCFDEFKSVRNGTGFIMIDGESHELLGILETRQLAYLGRYFTRFPIETRQKCAVYCDWYVRTISLIKKLFLEAQVIIDCFHIVQHIGRTFRNHRIAETRCFLKHKGPDK